MWNRLFRLFSVSLCAFYSSSSNRIQRTHVHDISPCLSQSAFLSHMAGAFRRTLYITGSCVAVYVTTGNAPAHQHTAQGQCGHRRFAPGFPSSCSGHAISACTCDNHVYATSSAVDLLPSTGKCCTLKLLFLFRLFRLEARRSLRVRFWRGTKSVTGPLSPAAGSRSAK